MADRYFAVFSRYFYPIQQTTTTYTGMGYYIRQRSWSNVMCSPLFVCLCVCLSVCLSLC